MNDLTALSTSMLQMAGDFANTAMAADVARSEYDHQMKSQYDYQKWYNQLAREENEYYWTTYNSPQAQMRAYSEAGLNPNLIYSNSNTISPIHDSTKSASEQDIPSPLANFDSVIQNYVNTSLAIQANERAERKLANETAESIARVNNLNSSITNRDANTQLVELRKTYQGLMNDFVSESNPLKVKYIKKQIDQVSQQIRESEYRITYGKKRFKLDEDKFEWSKDATKNMNPYVRAFLKFIGVESDDDIKPTRSLWQTFQDGYFGSSNASNISGHRGGPKGR